MSMERIINIIKYTLLVAVFTILWGALAIFFYTADSSAQSAPDVVVNAESPQGQAVANQNWQNLYQEQQQTANTVTAFVGNFTNGALNVANGGTGQSYSLVPRGIIVMWSGSIASIPQGWALCNGQTVTNSSGNGTITTPNLTDRFIIAADPTNYPPGATGNGSLPYTSVSSSLDNFNNAFSAGGSFKIISSTNGQNQGSSYTATGYFGSGSTVIAVYYALAYIEKT